MTSANDSSESGSKLKSDSKSRYTAAQHTQYTIEVFHGRAGPHNRPKSASRYSSHVLLCLRRQLFDRHLTIVVEYLAAEFYQPKVHRLLVLHLTSCLLLLTRTQRSLASVPWYWIDRVVNLYLSTWNRGH